MDIRPSEISDILKKQIAGFEAGAELSETGQVVKVGDGIATAQGIGLENSAQFINFNLLFLVKVIKLIKLTKPNFYQFNK